MIYLGSLLVLGSECNIIVILITLHLKQSQYRGPKVLSKGNVNSN